MKSKITTCLLLLAMVALFSSCHEKKTTRTIKTKVQLPQVNTETQALPPLSSTKHFAWGNFSCDASITRNPDRSLDTVSDTDGNRYFDNVVRLVLISPSKKILDREFRSSDFKNFISSSFLNPSRSALLDIGFSEVEGNEAIFIATVGSPDDMDDEYMLIQVRVSPQGQVSFVAVDELE